jgi:antirestriction protein ArdC
MNSTTVKRSPRRQRGGQSVIAQKRERLAALRDQLAQYEEQLEPGERAAILARFQGYSDRNALLIASQRPEATEVHGYRAWQALGRQVRKGETGIQILAPAGTSAGKPDAEVEPGDADEKARQFFRIAHVFDISQTEES